MFDKKKWNVKYNNELWYDYTDYHSTCVLDRSAKYYSADFYDKLYRFFLDTQPDLSIVYEDLTELINRTADDEELITFIRNNYPEIYYYKGNTMELQEELAEERAKLAALELAFKESQAQADQECCTSDCDCPITRTVETTALPYIRTLTGTNYDEPKPVPQPTEVVYSIRIQPDSLLHAKIIKVLDHWEYDDALLGFEVDYILEQQ